MHGFSMHVTSRAVPRARVWLEQLEPKKLELYFKARVLEQRIFNFQRIFIYFYLM